MASRLRNPDPTPPSARTSLFSQASSADTPPPPFYNTTFSAHRVSPLHVGRSPLDAQRLQALAQRLRDTLVGDVVRGVEVGLDGEDHVMGRAGALEAVQVRWVNVRDVLEVGAGRGLSVEVRYEAAVCTALLLPGGEAEAEEGFLELPLLLMRMPASLKVVIADFLAAAFDCRVSALRLGTRSMVRAWEAWIRAAGLPTRGPLAKDLVLSLGFYAPPVEKGAADEEGGDAERGTDQPLGLKSIEVFIPAAELRKFVDVGSSDSIRQSRDNKTEGNRGWEDDLKKRRKLAGRLREEGWEWRTSTNTEADGEESNVLGEQPFTEALGRYLDQHLGLNLFHPGVRIIKIACGGFVMSESRMKVFAPADLGEAAEGDNSASGQRGAVWELVEDLVDKARARDGNR
ncbi:kinetochore complex Sim4 subunit Fta1-domain-containing protein [Lasiosphaeris hirsuta]|uniref:Kinetochore complex Sim4 subunit Fta1-domain-containing protein n=1 Tax=Lasiosphaeris hirsuta TaxID=260670 RepID=A0AA40EEC8_9PEZI|nr:kinetochore complex Sim4 subunit Fta1-domain-containing protein [Lasiosphaeris hirsuta]